MSIRKNLLLSAAAAGLAAWLACPGTSLAGQEAHPCCPEAWSNQPITLAASQTKRQEATAKAKKKQLQRQNSKPGWKSGGVKPWENQSQTLPRTNTTR